MKSNFASWLLKTQQLSTRIIFTCSKTIKIQLPKKKAFLKKKKNVGKKGHVDIDRMLFWGIYQLLMLIISFSVWRGNQTKSQYFKGVRKEHKIRETQKPSWPFEQSHLNTMVVIWLEFAYNAAYSLTCSWNPHLQTYPH